LINPSLRLVLFAHPRSGSTSLYQILQLHPEVNILEEPFNENFIRWNPNNRNYRDLIRDIPSLDQQLTEIFATHNGIKVLDDQIPDELAVHLLQRPDCKIIFLRRKNLLQAIVSVLIAEQRQLWKKWEMIKPLIGYYQNLLPLDVHDVQRRLQALKKHLGFFKSVIDQLPERKAIKLSHEDLYFAATAIQFAQITAIWDFLRIAPIPWEQAQLTVFLPNASEIQQFCGNDVTGWLYE
jgi:hypothetical protein